MDDQDLNDSYMMYKSQIGEDIQISLGSVLLLGELGGGTSVIILRTGEAIYTRSPYEDILQDLEAYQGMHGGFTLISVLQADIIQTKEPRILFGGITKVISEEIN